MYENRLYNALFRLENTDGRGKGLSSVRTPTSHQPAPTNNFPKSKLPKTCKRLVSAESSRARLKTGLQVDVSPRLPAVTTRTRPLPAARTTSRAN